jgi:hypothetical protein
VYHAVTTDKPPTGDEKEGRLLTLLVKDSRDETRQFIGNNEELLRSTYDVNPLTFHFKPFYLCIRTQSLVFIRQQISHHLCRAFTVMVYEWRLATVEAFLTLCDTVKQRVETELKESKVAQTKKEGTVVGGVDENDDNVGW